MKKYFFGLLAVAFAVTSVAFTTTSKKQAKFAPQWFVYSTSAAQNATAAKIASNYVLADNPDVQPCDATTRTLCALKAEPSANPDQPVISGTLQSQIDQFFGLTTYDQNVIGERP